MSDNKDFGLFLKEELTKKTNLNVSQVASILKCSRSTLNDLFNGKRQLSKAFAKRIEEAFSSNSLSSSYSIKADSLLKKQAALIYGITEDHSNLKDDTNTRLSLDEVNSESSRVSSEDKNTFTNNTTSIQDQGIPFFAKITKQKIESYVDNNEQECRGLIPEFVYTLIATTASKDYLEKFYLPYGDDISLKGFDGIVSYSQNHPYIPKGLSVWEIGTSKDPKRKFDEDFSKAKEKLSKFSPSTDIHDVTYVAVFPRTISHQNQEIWIRQKKKEGSEFKNIRIIDAFLLAQWANLSVSVQLHFSKQFSNFEEDDLLTNIETSQLMYKEMSFDSIENGEELLDDLFSLYQNDYYDLFKSFIRTGLDGNILKAASESKILIKAFICYLAKVYDSEDKNKTSDNTVNAIEYQVNAALQYSEDKKQAKDTEFYGYEKSKYTNLFLNTYYIKDNALLSKLISSLKVKTILIVDEEIIDFKIRELCREKQNIRIVAIINSYSFDIMDSQDKAPSLVDELVFEDFFANSKKPVEEIELNPLPQNEIENTITSFISRELKNRKNKGGTHTNYSQADHLDLNKFSHDKIRKLSYLSEGSLLNLKEILSDKSEAGSSRLFIQKLKDQNINLNFLFCFCLMRKVNLEDKFDITVFNELLKDVDPIDKETELNKIVNLKLYKGIARFHDRCYFATSSYITLSALYKNNPIDYKKLLNNLYNTITVLLCTINCEIEEGLPPKAQLKKGKKELNRIYRELLISFKHIIEEIKRKPEINSNDSFIDSSFIIKNILSTVITRLLNSICFLTKVRYIKSELGIPKYNKRMLKDVEKIGDSLLFKDNAQKNHNSDYWFTKLSNYAEQFTIIDSDCYIDILKKNVKHYIQKYLKIVENESNDLTIYSLYSKSLLNSLLYYSQQNNEDLDSACYILFELYKAEFGKINNSEIEDYLVQIFNISNVKDNFDLNCKCSVLQKKIDNYSCTKKIINNVLDSYLKNKFYEVKPNCEWLDISLKKNNLNKEDINLAINKYLAIYLNSIKDSNNFKELKVCVQLLKYMDKDNLKKFESIVKELNQKLSEELKFSLLENIQKEKQELEKSTKIRDYLSLFLKNTSKYLKINSFFKNKWKFECVNLNNQIYYNLIPTEVIFANNKLKINYKTLLEQKSKQIYQIYKKERCEGIKKVISSCSNVDDIGFILVRKHQLTVEDRVNMLKFFINELRLITCNTNKKFTTSNDRMCLFSKDQNEDIKKSSYITNIISLLEDIASIDNGYLLKSTYNDYCIQNSLSTDESVNILIKFPLNKTTFDLADQDYSVFKKFWNYVISNISSNLLCNKEIYNRILFSCKKANLITEFALFNYAQIQNYFNVDLCYVVIKEILQRFNWYIKLHNKNITNKTALKYDKKTINNNDQNDFSYFNSFIHSILSHIDNFNLILLRLFSANRLNKKQKIIIELVLIPFIFLSDKTNKNDLINDLCCFLSASPKDFFSIFCENNSSQFDICYIFNHKVRFLKNYLSTDLLDQDFCCIPGFCIGQKPNISNISEWILTVIEEADKTEDNTLKSESIRILATMLANIPFDSKINVPIPQSEVVMTLKTIGKKDLTNLFLQKFFEKVDLFYSKEIESINISNKYNKLLKSFDKDTDTFKIIVQMRDWYRILSKEEKENQSIRTYSNMM